MTPNLLRPRLLKPAIIALSTLTLTFASWLAGCGPGAVEHHPDTSYTAESLADEFVFRYQSLPERTSARAKAQAAADEKAKAKLREADEGAKTSREEAARKKADVPTLEGLIDEFQAKLGQVKGLPRPDAVQKFLDGVSRSGKVRADDLQDVTARLKGAGA